MKLILSTFLHDMNGTQLKIGDTVMNKKGQIAEIKFGQYTHHIGGLSSPAYGIYFDGDEGFYLSEHLLENGELSVVVKKKYGMLGIGR